MSTILIAKKVKSSEEDRKYKQTDKLLLTCSDVPKKAIAENSKISFHLLTSMNTVCCKYTLQRRQGQYWRFKFLMLALNSNKDSVYFISTGAISQIFGT